MAVATEARPATAPTERSISAVPSTKVIETATTVRQDNGQALITDGPFADTKEFLGGYYLFEADNVDPVLEAAARIHAARMGGEIEVRPLVY